MTGGPLRPIIQEGRNTWRQVTVRDSGVLVDAADYYRAFYGAAQRARRYILLSGWQFNSGVQLLRGQDVPAGSEVRLLRFLNGLCRAEPALQIRILAWDFHLVFALEREWIQRIIFSWLTEPQVRFRFDDSAARDGSHHQKFAVIDGVLAFVGGIDLCEGRWDDRRHLECNPLRRSYGRLTKPYHDTQAYVRGGAAPLALAELFVSRWQRAAGERLHLPSCEAALPPPPPGRPISVGGGRVGLSRTDPRDPASPAREIEALLVDAVEAAESLIYVETQYFSSGRIYEAFRRRMAAGGRPRLEIVVVVNERAEAMKEEIAVGLRQAKILDNLRHLAERTGHQVGLYYPRGEGDHGVFRATYVHSKLMIVDDRFLTVGSANLTNRSMGTDSELQVSWEAGTAADQPRVRAIRRIRVSLLAEHAGLAGRADVRALARVQGLVARLDAIAQRPGARLQRHGPVRPGQRLAMDLVDPEELPFDPGFDDHGRAEPSEEAGHRLRTALRRAIAPVTRRLLGAARAPERQGIRLSHDKARASGRGRSV